MTTARILVRLVKTVALGVAAFGLAAAWIAPEDIPTLDVAPEHTVTAPTWDAADAAAHPGCVKAGTVGWVAARIVATSRDGHTTRVLPYTDATVARIDATWDNDDPTDDIFTIGACR